MYSIPEEEEFLDELSGPVENQSIFNRDRVFAHLNIHLGSGCFKLLTVRETKVDNTTQMTQSPVIELEFSNACWESEVRPQSSTWECKMSLGGIHVRDKLTKGSLFPELVAPQVKVKKRLVTAKYLTVIIIIIIILFIMIIIIIKCFISRKHLKARLQLQRHQ